MTRAYCIAATEVLSILNITEEKAVKKIPKEFLAFLKEKYNSYSILNKNKKLN